MKTKLLLPLILLTLITSLTSCASKEKPPRVRDETFIADIPPFEVGTFHLYAAFGLTKPKIYDFTAYFYPRSNMLYFTGRIGLDALNVGFSFTERSNLVAAKDKYIEAYETSSLRNEKPTKKNAFSKGSVSFNWGTLSPGYLAYANYYSNVEFILDNKPYFRLLFESTKGEKPDDNISSPRINVYISPAQWEQIIETCNQDRMVQMTDEILAQAEAF